MGALEELRAQVAHVAGDPAEWSNGFIAAQVLVLLGTLIVLTIFRRRYLHAFSNIPGPFLASFSRLWHIRNIIHGDQQIALQKQHEKYGHFVRVSHDEVSLSHPQAIRSLLIAPLKKADWYAIFCIPDYRTRGPLSIQDPRDKVKLNKYFREGFAQTAILRSEPYMDSAITILKEQMDKAAASKAAFPLGDFFSYVSYDITGEVTFSRSFDFTKQGEDIGQAIANNEAMELIFTLLGYFRWVSFIFCNPITTYLQILPLGYLGGITQAALTERGKNPDARFDLAAYWFRGLQRNPDPEVWNYDRLFACAFSALGAGSDTISCTMQSFTYHLMRHQDGWKKIQDEIAEARTRGECNDHIVAYEHAAKLPYLQAALKECLRVFAPVPMGLPRSVPKGGITIGENFFPEGSVLSINPHVMHMCKEHWGPDADQFKPERWLAPNAAELEQFFCPWGAGWATCPGQNLSRVQMTKMGATIVRDYDIRQVDPKAQWKWLAYFTIVPKSPEVYITKRSSL